MTTHRYMVHFETPDDWTAIRREQFDREARLALGIAMRAIYDKNDDVFFRNDIYTEHLVE